MATTTISGAGAHASAAATDRIPASKAGIKGYLTNSQIKDYILGLANTWTAQQTFAAGTITTSQPLTLTQTWNDGGVTFVGASIDITSTAAAGGSLPFRVRVGGSNVLSVSHLLGGITTSAYFNASTALQLITDSATLTLGTNADIILARDAAGALAQRNGTNAQTSNLYGNYVSSTDYHRLGASVAKTTLSNVSGASVTATSLIPDGAFLIGVTTKVTVALGGGSGTTGYQVGDGSDADRWGEATTITQGTSTDNTSATANPTGAFTSAQNVVITAVGGNFNGTGAIMVCAFYLIAQAD